MNSIVLICGTYYITLLQHLNIYRVSHFPHQNHVLKNLPQKSFKMFESKRMIRASTPHIKAKISAKVLIHLIRSRRNLTSCCNVGTQYPVDSSIVRYFHHNEEKMRGYKVKFRSHIRTHKFHCYTLKSNDDIAESFCCEHIEFEQPTTSTTSSSIANRNETSFQMLRE